MRSAATRCPEGSYGGRTARPTEGQMAEENYIIAPKRECRDRVAPDWQERLGEIKGIRVLGSLGERVRIQATPEAIDRVRRLLGDTHHIEETIRHLLR